MIDLNSLEPDATPVESRKDSAYAAMRVIRGTLKRMGRLRREFITPVPKTLPSGYVMMLVTPLPNRKGEIIGELRVWVYAPTDTKIPVRIRFEWTRNAFGFWYRNDFNLTSSGDQLDELMAGIKDSMRWVKTTADGTVRLASVNRMHFRKIKKNRTRDKAARIGMVMG